MANRFSVQFYYPNNQRFKVKNIINRLLGSTPGISRREYLVVQLEDPDNLFPDGMSNRKVNRAAIESQLNKNNPQAACISTRDYPLNEESSDLVTFYLHAPGEQLVKTNLKLTAHRKCRQLAPNFVTKRFFCAEIGSSEEINISNQIFRPKKILFNNKFNSPNQSLPQPTTPSSPTSNTTSIPFTVKLKNLFRIQSNFFHNHYSNLNPLTSSDEFRSLNVRKTLIRKNRSIFEMNSSTSFKDLLDGQPVFHKIDEQYTLIGFLIKAPFPQTLSFRHANLVLILDLKKFRFQMISKLIKSFRTAGRT